MALPAMAISHRCTHPQQRRFRAAVQISDASKRYTHDSVRYANDELARRIDGVSGRSEEKRGIILLLGSLFQLIIQTIYLSPNKTERRFMHRKPQIHFFVISLTKKLTSGANQRIFKNVKSITEK